MAPNSGNGIEETKIHLGDGIHKVLEDYKKKHEKSDERLDIHDLLLLEHTNDIKQLKENNVRLEEVFVSENRETRNVIMQSNQNLMGLINNILGFKTDNAQVESNSAIARWESVVKIVGILGSSGGIVSAALYYIFG